MRTLIFISPLLIWQTIGAQNVGIGTQTPFSTLHVKGGILLDSTNGTTPVSGAGTRLMWIPSKSAFRAGKVTGTQWNEENIGEYSAALGHNTIASGTLSLSLGQSNAATNGNAIAIGSFNTATALYSIAFGNASIANGQSSMAFGTNSTSKGFGSSTFGYGNVSKGDYSVALGGGLIAQSAGGVVTGFWNDSTDAGSLSNILPENRIFQVGNGQLFNRRNALTILYNGNTGIGTTTPLSLLQVKNGALLADGTVGGIPISGVGRRMMWIPEKGAFRGGTISNDKPNLWDADSIGENSFAAGFNALASGNTSAAIGGNAAATGPNAIALGQELRASGPNSLATGYGTLASGQLSTAMGYFNLASGSASTSFGTANVSSGLLSATFGSTNISSGNTATSFGYQNVASGTSSMAAGRFLKSKHFAGMVIGQYNDTTNSPNPENTHASNRLFQVGNGTADNLRSNALTVLQNGSIGIGEANPVVPLNFAGSTGAKISLWGTTGNQYGFGIQPSLLQIYTDISNSDIAFGHGNSLSFTERMRIKGNGNVGIGVANPTSPLHFASSLGNKIVLYGAGANHYGIGIQDNLIQFYTDGITGDIAFGFGNSGAFTERMRIKGTGNVEIKSGSLYVAGGASLNGDVYVQNGKAIIRSTGTQPLKKVTTQVTVNSSIGNSTSLAVNFNFSENFAAIPEAYVGNMVSNTSNGEMMVMTLQNLSATGGTLNVYNPRGGAGSASVTFMVNIIAIGRY